ncbi:MAG: PIN domain-containing protein [Candidatus Competibacteraceae bacterium]
MIFVDASFLLAVLNPRDALHSRAQAWAEVITEPLLVTEYVIWELVNALSMPADRAKVHAAIQEIQTAPEWEWVPASPELFSAGMQLHGERPDKAWSLTDCISFLTMQQRHIHRALTYDHHFEQAGYAALLRRDPG